MEKKSILVIDDDEALVRLIELSFTNEGYEVCKAYDGREGLRQMYRHKPDLVILDVVMPHMDGWETCRRIREFSDVPLIMLTVKEKEQDIVRGLEYGADDYVAKPVGIKELVARVRAALRRAELPPSIEKQTSYDDGFLNINLGERSILVAGERVKLTPTEFRLLAYLIDNAGRVLTHKQILEKVWGWEWIDDLDSLRIYVWHVRQKIEPDPAKPKYILTEPGVGYYFEKAP